MLRDYEMKSSCHMIEEVNVSPVHLVACKSVPFFMIFYAAKVTGVWFLLAGQRLQKSLSFNKNGR